MAVASSLNKVVYTADGENRTWTYPFPLLDEDHLRVYVTDPSGNDSLYTMGYTVDTTTSTVTFPMSQKVDPISEGWKVTLLRELPIVQNTDLNNQDAMEAETLEDAYDYLTMVAQQLDEKINRSLKSSVSSYMYSGSSGGSSSEESSGDYIAEYEAGLAALQKQLEIWAASYCAELIGNMLTEKIDLYMDGHPVVDLESRAKIVDLSETLTEAIETGDQAAIRVYENAAEAYLETLANIEDWKGIMKDAGINPIKDSSGNITGYNIYAVEKSKDDVTNMITTARSDLLVEAEQVAMRTARTTANTVLAGSTTSEIQQNLLNQLSKRVDEAELLLEQKTGDLTVTPDQINSAVSDLQLWSGTPSESPFATYAQTQIDQTATAIKQEAQKLYVDLDTLDTHVTEAVSELSTDLGAKLENRVVDGLYELEGSLADQDLSTLLLAGAKSLQSRNYENLKALLNSRIAYADEQLRAYVSKNNRATSEKILSMASIINGNYSAVKESLTAIATNNEATLEKLEQYRSEAKGFETSVSEELRTWVRDNYACISKTEDLVAKAAEGAVASAKSDLELTATKLEQSVKNVEAYVTGDGSWTADLSKADIEDMKKNGVVKGFTQFKKKYVGITNDLEDRIENTETFVTKYDDTVDAKGNVTKKGNFTLLQDQVTSVSSKLETEVKKIETLQSYTNGVAAELKQEKAIKNGTCLYKMRLNSNDTAISCMAMTANSKSGESMVAFGANNFYICTSDPTINTSTGKFVGKAIFMTYKVDAGNDTVGINGNLFVKGSITGDTIAANTVKAGNLGSGSVTNAKLGSSSVSTVKVAAQAVTGYTSTSKGDDLANSGIYVGDEVTIASMYIAVSGGYPVFYNFKNSGIRSTWTYESSGSCGSDDRSEHYDYSPYIKIYWGTTSGALTKLLEAYNINSGIAQTCPFTIESDKGVTKYCTLYTKGVSGFFLPGSSTTAVYITIRASCETPVSNYTTSGNGMNKSAMASMLSTRAQGRYYAPHLITGGALIVQAAKR